VVDNPSVRFPVERARTSHILLINALVAGVYYASARISLQVALVGETVTPVWPPTGIAVVALLLFGRKVWPGIAVSAFFVNVFDQGAGISFLITCGNTAAPLFSHALLRAADFRLGIERLRDALALVFLGSLVAMTVSASIGSLALFAGGAVEASDLASTWSVWWAGDALGVLVFAPLLLVLPSIGRGLSWSARAECAFVVVAAAFVASLVTRSDLSLLFVVFPIAVYAALRFQQSGAAPTVTVIAVIAVSAAVDGVGPFEGRTLFQKMLTLQAFNGSLALMTFLLAALMTERARTRALIETMRRRQAFELNDEIVQGLTVASYALELDDAPTAKRALAKTLDGARAIVAGLLESDGSSEIEPGELRRERAAEVGATKPRP
jgi:integral membrane sensor domain MASE1